MNILRPIGYSELLAEYINHVTPHNIVALGIINTAIDPEVINEAAKIITMQHPLLQAYIDYKGYAKFSKNCGDIFHSYAHYKNPSEPLDNFIEQQIKIQLTRSSQSLMNVTQISYTQKTVILLTLQHTISDGISILSLISELFKIADTLISKKKHAFSINQLKPSLDNLLFKKKIIINDDLKLSLARNLRQEKKIIGNRSTGVKSIRLNTTQKNKLILFSKENNVTVTKTILAILIKILHKHTLNNALNFDANIMVNFRKYLDNKIMSNDLGFYCGYLNIEIDTSNPETKKLIHDIDIKIDDYFHKNKHFDFSRDYKDLLESCEKIEDIFENIKVEKPTIGISNTGITRPYDYKNFTLTEASFYVSCHAYSRTENTFFICMNTYLDKMFINFHHPLPIFSRNRIEKITKDFISFIDLL